MNFRDLTTKAYFIYHDLIDSRSVSFDHSLLPYEYPSDGRFQYHWQEEDFTRELVNKFNEYVMTVHRLRLWERVLSEFSSEHHYELRNEFSNALLESAMGYPYRYRSNLIFCTTMLCYIDGLSRKTLSRSDIKKESEITLNVLRSIDSKFLGVTELIEVLTAIDAPDFRHATSNFRNRLQHQHAPRVEHGQISIVQIEFPDDKSTSFDFGVQEPLKASELLSLLTEQIEPMRAGFHAYRVVVDGHIGTRT